MNSHEITERWALGTLERGYVFNYLIDNVAPRIIDRESLDHITEMCFALYNWSRHAGRELGSFLRAIVDNDWSAVCLYADNCNRQYNWMIHMFLYNCAPTKWRELGKEKEEL